MKCEQQFFLKILADHIKNQPTELPEEELDWTQMLAIIDMQNLSGLAYTQLKSVLKGDDRFSEIGNKLRKAFLASIYSYTRRQQDFQELEEEFTRQNIPFLPMKGQVLSRYYPVPEVRTMGDIDFLIRPGDRQRSHEVLCKMGYVSQIPFDSVWDYFKKFVFYEVHDHLYYEPSFNQVDYGAYFDHVWEHAKPVDASSRYEMSENYHFIYLIVHTAKHMVNQGSGFRPFLDMVFLVRSAGERMDWNWLQKELSEICLLDFTKTCFELCERWFDVEMPLAFGELDEKFYQDVTRKVFADGIFGQTNEENNVASYSKTYHHSRWPYWWTAVSIMFCRLFPGYQEMKEIPHYSFLNKRPYLLPVAWIYRYGYCIRYKFSDARERLREPFAMQDEIKKREERITKLGL